MPGVMGRIGLARFGLFSILTAAHRLRKSFGPRVICRCVLREAARGGCIDRKLSAYDHGVTGRGRATPSIVTSSRLSKKPM